MKFEIKNRFTGAVQVVAEIECAEDAPVSIKLGLAVKWAYRAGAYLADAYLADANLADAYLADANLAGANLAGANLAGANLARANLAGANLADANLADALKVDPSEIPVIPNIDSVILSHIEAGGKLEMGAWHTCQTTHCRAGWAIHLGGDKGYALEKKVGPQMAGALIYRASRPGKHVPNFYASTEDSMEDLRKCAAEELGNAG